MKKSMVIFLIVIMIFSSLGAISAATPARNHTNSAQCYNCNDSSQCYCDDNCLCKDPNYIQKIGGVNKIRNNDSCYRCNETCYCPDNCSCKQPYSQEEIEESKEYMSYENNFFVKTFRNTPVIYVVYNIYIIIHPSPYPIPAPGPMPWPIPGPGPVNNTTYNETNTTTDNGTINNTTVDNGTNTTVDNGTSDNGTVTPGDNSTSDPGNTNSGDTGIDDGSSGDTGDSGNAGNTGDSGSSGDTSDSGSSGDVASQSAGSTNS